MRWYTKLLMGTLCVVKLTLVAGIPENAVAYGAYDDALFVRLAREIAEGHWLGKYDSLTLAKGPGFPLFLAACYRLGIPLNLGDQLLYIFFCLVMVEALRPVIGKNLWPLLILTVLLFNPVSFPVGDIARVFRDRPYVSLSGLVLATSIALVLRREAKLSHVAPWAWGLAISLGFFWITREEGLWILPSVALPLGFAAIALMIRRPPAWRWKIANLAAPLAVAGLLVCSVGEINRIEYGQFIVTETQDPAFKAAYGALTRVTPAVPNRVVPVSAEVRQRIYKVSPAFAELRPYLEGKIGDLWVSAGQANFVYVKGEIDGGWFEWALRNAVAAAGHAGSAPDAHRFYKRLAAEVNAACDRGLLPAGPRRDTVAPPWHWDYLNPALLIARHGWRELIHFHYVTTEIPRSEGDINTLAEFRQLTRQNISPPTGADAAHYARQLQTIGSIINIYSAVTPLWSDLSLVVFAITLFLAATGRRTINVILGAALLGGIVTMLALLSLIQLTSFPSISVLYMSPLYPLLLTFNCLMTWELCSLAPPAWNRLFRRRRPETNRQPAPRSQVQL